MEYIRYDEYENDYIQVIALFETGDPVEILRIYTKMYLKHKEVKELQLREGLSCGVFQHNEMYTELGCPSFDEIHQPFSNDPPEFRNAWNGIWSIAMTAHWYYIGALLTTSWPHLAIFSDQLNEDPAVEAIHNRIDRLFGKNVKYELKTTSGMEKHTFLPKFIKFNRTILFFSLLPGETKCYEEYFLGQPKQDFVLIGNTSSIGHFNPESKIFDADTLVFYCAQNYTGSDILCNFRGRRAFIWNASCTDDMLIQIFKKWKNGEISQNMTTLRLNSYRYIFNSNRIKQETGIRELTNSDYLLVVDAYYRPNYLNCRLHKKTIPHTISSYIVREDGMMAYVSVTENDIVFEVQEFTAIEILEAISRSV